ncbi:hypothetical protein IKE84_02360 [Candidatus Saccharibacteria bacterium]|nr:hypothetical protein [Candidatus Saccharibacteria bacterium]
MLSKQLNNVTKGKIVNTHAKNNVFWASVIPLLYILLSIAFCSIAALSFGNPPAMATSDNSSFSVNLINPFQTIATAKGYYLGIINNGEVDVDIAPTPNGAYGLGVNNLNVLTNSPLGYHLYLSSDQAEDYPAVSGKTRPGNALYLNDDSSSEYFIKPTSGTPSNPARLSLNSWGYNMDSSNNAGYSHIPLSTSPVLIKSTNQAETEKDQENSKADIYYGVLANSNLPSGTYIGRVLYTAYSEANTTSEATITPSTTSNFAGGDTVRVVTSLFSIGDPGEVSVSIGPDNSTENTPNTNACTNPIIDYEDEVLAVTCTLPEKPAIARSYDVTVVIPKYDKTYTIPNGLAYEYVNKMTTISQMQQMTPSICSETTTPVAKDEGGNVVTNVPQATLYDVRDNNSYTVRKLADGHCWMVQNLRLVGSKTLTSADSNVSSNFTLTASTTSGWCQDAAANCVNKSMVLYSGNVNYGTYYNWYAATAGTGTFAKTSGSTSSSVCPKGWKMPAGGASGDWRVLTDTYNATMTALVGDPVNLVLAGGRYGSSTTGQTTVGYYWGSTAVSDFDASRIYFTSSVVDSNSNEHKSTGIPVRCLSI